MITITTIDDQHFTYEDGNTTTTLEAKLNKKTGRYFLALPQNDLNRKFVEVNQVVKAGGTLTIDTYKETKHITRDGSTKTPKSIKNWTDFLTDDERETYETLKRQCEYRAKRQAILDEIEALNFKLKGLND